MNFTRVSVEGGEGTDAISLATVNAGTNIYINGNQGDDNVTGAAVASSLFGGSGSDFVIGGAAADTITGGEGDDSLTGNGGIDVFTINSGTDAITDLGAGTAVATFIINNAQSTANITVSADYVVTNASSNIGTANITSGAGAVDIDLSAIGQPTGAAGFTMTGLTGIEILTGTAQADTITGAVGADTLTGGAGANRFIQAAGSSATAVGGAISATQFDTITDWATGTSVIDFQSAITVNGSAGAAVATTKALVGATGIATFAAADNTLAERLTAISTVTGGATTNLVAGEAAIFTQGTDAYLFISDGVNGLGANDVLIELEGEAAGALTVGTGAAVNQITNIA